MKLANNLSSTKTYSQQLVVPRASWETLRVPKYILITTVLLAFALLAGASILREREAVRASRNTHDYTQNNLQETQTANQLLRKDIAALKNDKEAIVREAQNRLHYLRPNEIVVVVK